ncbi:phosphate acetyltransferase [Buchnera aphidicola]|uniref:phosphate acetyltransferase n=1 Tax=Buchnera aphidicola TaxID=9 RepID=UPI0034639AB4
MTRTIILVPVGYHIGLTSVSLGIIDILQQEKNKILFFKPVFEYSNDCGKLDDTSSIIKKYSITSYLKPIDCNILEIVSSTSKEKYFFKKNLDLYFLYQNKYDIILIEGIKSKSKHFLINDLNFKLANHLHAELIFVVSNHSNYTSWCIQKKNIFNKYINIKYNILGTIINHIFLNYKKIYIHNFAKDLNFKQNNKKLIENIFFSPIIGDISWNKDLIYLPIDKIFRYLQINTLQNNCNMHLINSFLLYNDSILNTITSYENTVLIIPFNIFYKKCSILFFDILNNLNFHSILFTDKYCMSFSQRNIFLEYLHNTINIFYTVLNLQNVVFLLKNFKLNILQKNNIQIKNSNIYFSKCINENLILSSNQSSKFTNFKTMSPFYFSNHIKSYAKKLKRSILFPEGHDLRIIQSASIATDLGLAKCILLGNKKRIHEIASRVGINFSKKIKIIDPDLVRLNYIPALLELRHSKGMNHQIAQSSVYDNMVLGSLILMKENFDGLVCGIKYTSSHVLRTALQLIGVRSHMHKFSLVFSSFFMLLPDRVLIYADCAMNINPNANELSEIAIQSADFAKILGIEPRIAMLSYSTGDSGQGETVNKVAQATLLVRKKRPDLIIDGPIQYDASVNIIISNIKSPSSPLHGNATVFIFPDLNSGNISYKVIQQSLNIISVGPVLYGLKKPVNDLSRGASIDDIIYTICMTAIQSDYFHLDQ